MVSTKGLTMHEVWVVCSMP